MTLQQAPSAKEVSVCYAKVPDPVLEDGSYHLQLPTDAVRSKARLVSRLKQPSLARDALLALGDVLMSDLRFKPRDRAEYLAYLLSKGKGVSEQLWNAQKAYLEARYGEEQHMEAPLDPVLTVSEDGLSFEVFSADESAYARLFFDAGASYEVEEAASGTTHIELSLKMLDHVAGIRSYRATRLTLTPSVEGEKRTVKVPYRWIRAFGQLQAATTLPLTSFEIAPIDLYNVLLSLRMQRAKKSPRALRFELVPGEPPRMVLEPWDLVIAGTAGSYEGSEPRVVRTWGRKRLMSLARLLPHAKSIRVFLLGAGLPAYYVVEMEGAALTLALSGWTDSGWAGIATFDLLTASEVDELLLRKTLSEIEEKGKTLDELTKALGKDRQQVRQALLWQMQKGVVINDIATGRFLHRPLFAEPPSPEALRYRDENERQAHRLLEVKGQVEITKIHDLGTEGVRIEGEVTDAQAHRTYKTSFTIDREGRTVDASCTSPQFKRSGLREGPTVPMMALRLLYTRMQVELEKARTTEEGRKLIRAETRTMIRRDRRGTVIFRLSLDGCQVAVRWGPHPDRMRFQRLFFTSEESASSDYFGRLGRLSRLGFIDASAAEAV